MKRMFILLLSLCVLGACRKSKPGPEYGFLHVSVGIDRSEPAVLSSRAGITDPSRYTVEIYGGETLVERFAPIGAEPRRVELTAGDYTVRAFSEQFTEPSFDQPVYGTSAPARIVKGENTPVSLVCRQTNTGVRILYSETFRNQHRVYATKVSQAAGGTLNFSQTETRTGYFVPGALTVETVADGVVHSQRIDTDPCKIYEVLIDEAAQVTSGALQLNISVVTAVETEKITMQFPEASDPLPPAESEQGVCYYEDLGTSSVSNDVLVGSYANWRERSVVYGGSGVAVSSVNAASNSDYTGASGGNHFFFKQAGAELTVSGINTSGVSAGTPLGLSFGVYSNSAFDEETFRVFYSENGSAFEPLDLDYQPVSGWQLVEAWDDLPAAANLRIRITGGTGYRVDDLRIGER